MRTTQLTVNHYQTPTISKQLKDINYGDWFEATGFSSHIPSNKSMVWIRTHDDQVYNVTEGYALCLSSGLIEAQNYKHISSIIITIP